mgnify:CR=1 FL=1
MIARAIDDRLDPVLTLQRAVMPEVWSTSAEFDLKQRLSKLPFYVPTGLGDTISDLSALLGKGGQILSKAGPYLDTVLEIVQDPALPQLITKVKVLKAADAGASPSAAPGGTAAPGVGLNRVLPLWDVAIFYTKYPWAPWAIGAGAVVLLGGIGFGIGRATKKCRTGMGRSYRRRR